MNLVKWDKIRTQIELSKDIEELSKISSMLKAYQKLAEQTKQSMEVQAKITIYIARADKKKGEWLKNNIKKGNPNQLKDTNIVSLKDIGVSANESSRLQKVAEIPEKTFENILSTAEVETKKITNNMLVSISKEINRSDRRNKEHREREEKTENLDVRHGDFNEVLSDVFNIDAIITDPPYPKEFLNCFSELSAFAGTHLKEDGFVVVYSGQYHLPEVIKRLSEHLTYVWTFCLSHEGKTQLVNGVNIMCGWKPVLVFSKGRKKMRYPAFDVLISDKREKSSHEWQQSEGGVQKLIEIFTAPKELVVDPFSGSGTFGVVATQMDRKFIGAEINGKERKNK